MSLSQSTAKYNRISPADIQDEKYAEAGPRRSRKCPWTMTTLAVVLVTTIFGILSFLVMGVYYDSYGHKIEAELHPCGNSSAEARERGCQFDQLMWSWFPPHCPHYANDIYLQSGPDRPWRFFSDPYKRIEATDEDWVKVLDNEVDLYGERQEHLAHCVFMFLSMAEILRDNGLHTQKYRDFEHFEHCADILMKLIKSDVQGEEVETFAGPVSFTQNC